MKPLRLNMNRNFGASPALERRWGHGGKHRPAAEAVRSDSEAGSPRRVWGPDEAEPDEAAFRVSALGTACSSISGLTRVHGRLQSRDRSLHARRNVPFEPVQFAGFLILRLCQRELALACQNMTQHVARQWIQRFLQDGPLQVRRAAGQTRGVALPTPVPRMPPVARSPR